MASITDHTAKPGSLSDRDANLRPRKQRFRLFAALAAPFVDMDERALHKKRPHGPVRNNSKGNMFTTTVETPAQKTSRNGR